MSHESNTVNSSMAGATSSLCGDIGGQFWDFNLTWYSSNPDFTACFKDTALFWIPSAVFWTFVPFDLADCYRSCGYPSKSFFGRFQLACQTFTTVLFLALTIFNLVQWQMGYIVWFWWGFASYVLYAITMVAIIILCWYQMKAGFTGSAAIWLSLLFSGLCNAVHFVSAIDSSLQQYSMDTMAFRMLFVVYYVMLLLTLIAFSFSSVPTPSHFEETGQVTFPEDFCSFPNRFAFYWVLPMLWKAYKRDLDIKDVWATHPTEKSSFLISNYEDIIRKEFAINVESERQERFGNALSLEEVTIKTPKNSASLTKILVKEFSGSALINGTLELINVLLTFVSPIVIGLLTSFATNIHREQRWHGYAYAALLACALFSQACLDQFAWLKQVRLSRKVTAVLVGCIYRKALRLTSEARKSITHGEIVNLMSIDAGRFFDFTIAMHTIWLTPVQFIVGCYIAHRQVGVAVWAGVGYVLAVSIVNAVVGHYNEQLIKRQMEYKDERMKLVTEVLNGMKVIKLHGWEPAFHRRIGEIRENELTQMRYGSYIGAFYQFCWKSTGLMASLAVLITYVALQPDSSLEAGPVFVILTIFHTMTFPLSRMPMILSNLAMIRVSLKRITDYFSCQEMETDRFGSMVQSDAAIYLENATFAWDSTIGPVLRDLSVRIPAGSLVAVVGPVGAGKSSFLSALRGEMHKFNGIISVKGSFAYVSQQAWIPNMSVKDNILFGKSLNERDYNAVIEACCLRPDFDSFPAGDQAEIGSRGDNLSGGQKQRVSLARAVYQNRDIYLLDDPLSAVDVHVGKHIFEHVIGPNGILKNKTRVLVTHSLAYLPQCDVVLAMADGRIREAGQFEDLVAKNGAFANFIQRYLIQTPKGELGEVKKRELESQERLDTAEAVLRSEVSQQKMQESPSRMTEMNAQIPTRADPLLNEEECDGAVAGNVIGREVMHTGGVSCSVYRMYAKAAGTWLILFVIFVIISLVFQMLGSIWLQKWSDNSPSVKDNGTYLAIPMSKGLLYLGLCGVGQMTATLMLGIAFAMFKMKAAMLIHDKLLDAILKAPMLFYDTTPTGRIANRCGNDMNIIDNNLPDSLAKVFHTVFLLAYSVVGLFIYVPAFGGVLLPACVAFLLVQRIYVAAARRVRRLAAVTNSAIYSHFEETLQGVSTINAFNAGPRFCATLDQLVDIQFSAQMARFLFNTSVTICLNLISSSIVTATAFAIAYLVIDGSMTAGVAGLLLSSFALDVPELLGRGVHVITNLEMDCVAMERIAEYTNVEPEAPWTLPCAPPGWPSEGSLRFRHYSTRYRDGLPLALCDLSVDTQPKEKIGIIGRTGAGKSSLTLALFRIIEAAEGSISIDDVDISHLGLHELRRKLTIIPQDPILFSGSLRLNLDPFAQRTDDDLLLELERRSLKGFVTSFSGGLKHRIDEGGSNLSVGQRQLICLARALLGQSKILVLDEATAAIDVETDAYIQATIRQQFKDCTIITIAHRLNTIMDSDRIIILHNGRLIACGPPAVLAADESSTFGKMLKEAGLLI